jgi:DNA polymerase-3 subunit alpha
MSGQSDLEKIAKYASLLKRYNLKLLLPDINNSDADFKPTDNGILYGFALIQGLGDGALEKIISARDKPFKSLIDFMFRTNVSSAIAETLIKAGAFDSLHDNRASLLASIPIISKWVSSRKRFVKKEQSTLAIPGLDWSESLSYPQLVKCSELQTNELLKLEKEAIGLSLSGHPLDEWMIEAEYLGSLKVNQVINGVVLVKSSRSSYTKKGEEMGFATVEDCEGNTLDVTLFGVNWQCFGRYFKPGEVINISGKVQVYNEKFSMIVDGAYSNAVKTTSFKVWE